jgi:hypothetical protein
MANGTLNDFVYRFVSWKALLVIAWENCLPDRFRIGTPLWASAAKVLNGRLGGNTVGVWTLNSDRSEAFRQHYFAERYPGLPAQ